ncbi:MAG: hypothetical protein MZW92_14165 [Comamonadaceae bacterium]|nr:hypothetical protein [Comamonadaceae bacterium]
MVRVVRGSPRRFRRPRTRWRWQRAAARRRRGACGSAVPQLGRGRRTSTTSTRWPSEPGVAICAGCRPGEALPAEGTDVGAAAGARGSRGPTLRGRCAANGWATDILRPSRAAAGARWGCAPASRRWVGACADRDRTWRAAPGETPGLGLRWTWRP